MGTHKVDKTEAISSLNKAKALRKKDAADFLKEDTENSKNIKAMTKADVAITKGLSKSFLQTDEADTLQRVVEASDFDMDSADRDTLKAFLQSDGEGGDVGAQEILGIIRQMKETMVK